MLPASAHIVKIAALVIALTAPLSAQEVHLQIKGESAGDLFGQSVAPAGDVNNDGVVDFVVGAPGASPNGDESGSVLVLSGLDGSELLRFDGSLSGDHLGSSVDGAGDVNSDGFDDIIAGAPNAANNGIDSGMARVYSGLTGSIIHEQLGKAAGFRHGTAVTGIGDLNGDGFDEYASTAPGFSWMAPQGGLVWVFSGATNTIFFSIRGLSSDLQLGTHITSVGDADGDAVPDIAVMVPGDQTSTSVGLIRLVSGAGKQTIMDLRAPGSIGAPGILSRSIADAGDVDNDGLSDIIAGGDAMDLGPCTGGSDPCGTAPYTTHVFSSAFGSHIRSHIGSANPASLDDRGSAVSSAGDVNSDGHDDYIIGASQFLTSTGNVGTIRIHSGVNGNIISSLSGSSHGDRLGQSLAVIGDLNDDGLGEVVVGAPGTDNPGTDAGSAVVYDLSEGSTPEEIRWFVPGDELIGSLAMPPSVHKYAFAGVQGMTLKLMVKTPFGFLSPRISVLKANEELLKQWSIPHWMNKVKKEIKLPDSGTYFVHVEGDFGSFGQYTINTGRKMPPSGRRQKMLGKSGPGGFVAITVAALPESNLSVIVKPIKGVATPMSFSLIDPAGFAVDHSAATEETVGGGVKVKGLGLPVAGKYEIRIIGFSSGKEAVRIKVIPKHPLGHAKILEID